MAFLISNGTSVPHATNNEDFLLRLIRFLCGVDYPTFSGTGGVRLRYVRAAASAVAETWTITCTNAGTGTFSVVGSVSGAEANATVGTAYDNGKIAFTLANISGAAVLSDVITVGTFAGPLIASGQCWDLIRQSVPAADEIETALRGRGIGGADQIFVNIRAYKSVASDYYNLQMRGAIGYLEANNYSTQPGASPLAEVCLQSGAMPYWLIANGRRFMFVVKVATVYESAYCGFILPTGTTGEYPYPLAIGGSHSVTGRRYSDNLAAGSSGSAHRAFFNPNGALKLITKQGSWLSFANYSYASSENKITSGNNVTPFSDLAINRTIDNGYVLYPLTLSGTEPAIYGDLQGVFMISGFANASENIAQNGGVDHLVVQNVFRTDVSEFAAFRLE